MPEYTDWTRAFALLAWDGSQWVAVKVGTDGSLYAVLQGEYEGALQTVALDSEGRISAFVIDTADAWGRLLAVGNAELAARLGSPMTYDRRGQVLVVDTFEAGLQRWVTHLEGTGSSIVLDPLAAMTGGYSVKLTGGSDGAGKATMYHRGGIIPTGRCGLTAAFALDDAIKELIFYFDVYDGTNLIRGAIRWYETGTLLKYLALAGGWVEIGTFAPCTRGPQFFNWFKLVIDTDTEEYVRLQMNDTEYDLSGIALRKTGSGLAAVFNVKIELWSRSGENDWCNIDDVIVTVAEPE